jgi:MerR family transcriptional regulator, light-induced transcriptional regulator
MEGSRPPSSGATRVGFALNSATVSEQICLDRPRFQGRPTLPKPDLCIDETLGDVIAGEILPRLMLRHSKLDGSPRKDRWSADPAAPLLSKVADFADLVVRHETDVADAYVKFLLRRGLDLQTVLLQLLAPTARRLGQLWEADTIDFIDVTIGMSRLQTLIHRLTLPLASPADRPDRRLLLVPAPGEQHTFGLVMISELFRREGWRVHGTASMEPRELTSLISSEWFDIIGFSLSCERLLEPLSSFIQVARRMSKNKSVRVMVGGGVFAQDAARSACVGVDLIALDAREALVLAENALNKSLIV